MKLWDKGYTVNEKIDKFTIGKDRELDIYIAKYDVLGNLAQSKMLAKVGLISTEESISLNNALTDLLKEINEGNFIIEEEFEDIHSKIEHYLTIKCGEAGKKIHTARSRNDQVLTALLLFYKDYCKKLTQLVEDLFDVFIKKAEKHKADLLPGYTHFQAAMPSSFGLLFSAYAEQLILDLYLLEGVFKTIDQNPLGSAAGFGTSFPIDRDFTTKELNFSNTLISSVGAQMLRGKAEKALSFAIAQLAGTLSKFAYDMVLYNGQEFGFLKLPKEFTTGSSIMPHKKNPDVFELIRAQCNKIQALPNSLILTINNLPSGYHRDFQILKEILFEPIIQLLDVMEITIHAVNNLEVVENKIDDPKYNNIYTVENINQKIQSGVPFRDAYKEIGLQVENNTFAPQKNFKTTHIGSIHNLALDRITAKLKQFKENSEIYNFLKG